MRKFVVSGLVVVLAESFLLATAFAEGSETTQRKFNTWAVEKSKASANVKETTTATKPDVSSNWKKRLEAKMKAQQAAKAPAGAKQNSTNTKAVLKKNAKEKRLKSKPKDNGKNNKTVVTNTNQKLRWESYAKTGIKNLNGDAVVKEASKYKGVRYVFGGTTPKGFDCSGYVQYVFKRLNANLTRTADTQVREGVFVTQRQLKSGDLVFFSTYEPGASHVGIYAGNGKFWNATSSRGIMLCDLKDSYWRTRYYGARRVLVANGEPK